MRSISIRIIFLILVLLAVFYYFSHYLKAPLCLEFVEAEWMPAGKTPLTLQEVKEKYGKDAYIDSVKVTSFVLTKHQVDERPIVLKKVFLTGEDIEDVWVAENEAGVPALNIKFKSGAAKILNEITPRTNPAPIAILLNKKIISAPTIYEPIIDGRLEITQDLITEDIDELADKLKKMRK
jgi:preprotein translocase subunit SecD